MRELTIRNLVDDLSKDIREREENTAAAIGSMERMGITPDDYKRANQQLGANAFVATFLTYIRREVENADAKGAENLLRFHSYTQRAKGRLDDQSITALGQAAVAVILDGYIEKYFAA